MEVIILTGMSGAGKSLAANYLEDMGFFCIDNLPPRLLPDIIAPYTRNPVVHNGYEPGDLRRMAFVIDVRSSSSFKDIVPSLHKLDELDVRYQVIFLEASDQVLISRYKQSRRNHPLAQNISIVQALELERERLAPLKDYAGIVIDTTTLTPLALKDKLHEALSLENRDERMTILVQSFGFKYGVPVDCDCVMDVRFIPNPFYDPSLRHLSGLDEPVRTFVMDHDVTQHYLSLQLDLFHYTIPFYVKEGKVRLTIGIGCTGGRHRSVAMTEYFAAKLREIGLRVIVDHRDLQKDAASGHLEQQKSH